MIISNVCIIANLIPTGGSVWCTSSGDGISFVWGCTPALTQFCHCPYLSMFVRVRPFPSSRPSMFNFFNSTFGVECWTFDVQFFSRPLLPTLHPYTLTLFYPSTFHTFPTFPTLLTTHNSSNYSPCSHITKGYNTNCALIFVTPAKAGVQCDILLHTSLPWNNLVK